MKENSRVMVLEDYIDVALKKIREGDIGRTEYKTESLYNTWRVEIPMTDPNGIEYIYHTIIPESLLVIV